MITSVTNSTDMRLALNENLHGLLTGKRKRKPLIVKEVNNTLGKMLSDVKMEMMQNMLTGNRSQIPWFDRNYTKKIEDKSNGSGKKVLAKTV